MFRVDVLLKALKELQKEKTENEQLLAEECHKRKRLEVRAEAATSTLNLTSEKHAKTRESVRMEEQRVDQTQQQIHQHEQINDGIRTKIAKLNQQIEQSKEEERANLSTFEEEMGHLMHKFRSGWQNTMESSMEDYEEQRLKLAEKAEALQSRLNLLRAQIQAECSKKDTADTTPQSTLDQVREMFEAENLASKAALGRQKQTLQELEKELALEERSLAGLNIQREP